MNRFAVTAAILIVSASAGGLTARADDAAAGKEFFEKRIRPVLVRHCYECHSAAAKEPKGQLRLDSREAARTGGESGPAVVPGKPHESLLISALRYDGLEMPPKRKLPDEVIADFVRWIEMGAPDPREQAASADEAAAQTWEAQYADRIGWWSLQPVVEPRVPQVNNADWSDQPIDRFILAALEARELQPAASADRRSLARRLSFALRGLPPTPEEVAQFVDDDSPDAWERLVDCWLASPSFGERWARHWMDVVRYTDTYGYEWDIPAKGAWSYRDYLVRAFNDDVPFDQLIREQLAGDLLDKPRVDAVRQVNESLHGVMFFQMGEKRHGDSSEFDGIHQEMLDNKIDAFSKAFQATTMSCARCHDHKLDPVAQSEYYGLSGVFMSSRWVTNTLDLPERNAEVIARLKKFKQRLRGALAKQWNDDAKHLAERLKGLTNSSTSSKDVKQQGSPTNDEGANAKLALEDILAPWRMLTAEIQKENNASVAESWKQIAERYAAERKSRTAHNQGHFRLLADFSQGVPAGWSVDGVGLREVVRAGDFTVALDGEGIVGRMLPGGLFTNVLSPRLNGSLRTPYLKEFDAGHISFECCGGDFAAHRSVIDNAFLTEKQKYLNSVDPQWTLLSTFASMKERKNYIEFATKTSNPNFPPRVGLGEALTAEQIHDPRSWFGVTRVVLHNAPLTPKDELARFESLFAGDLPTDLNAAADRYASWLNQSLARWTSDEATADDVRLINGMIDQGWLGNRIETSGISEIRSLVDDYRATEQQLETPCTINGMADLDHGEDSRVYVRGDYAQLGPPVPRGYVKMLCGEHREFDVEQSGRRKLAEHVADRENPLTARVFVNRVWHWLFGMGIVATTDDFGHVGDVPSHPELLDYLAARFMAEQWSLKRLVRAIVLTETWRQSSASAPQAVTADPANRLLHHYPLLRLEAEEIRDAILQVSGRLDDRLFGEPIDPHRLSEDPQKRLFSGPLDGNGRRSIYTKITIMEPPKFLATFNQPTPKIPTGRRDVTNTPGQSLALLNDPFVVDQAAYWGKRLAETDDVTAVARVSRMFGAAYGRAPDDVELTRWMNAMRDLARLHGIDENHVLRSSAVWRDIAHAMFNTKEFIYVR